MAGETISFGTTFAFSSATPPAAIAGVRSIESGDADITQIQFGALDDAGRALNYKNGRIKNGEFTVNFEYRKTNFGTLHGLKGHASPQNFLINYSDGSSESGTANLSKLSNVVPAPEDDALVFSASFNISGATTFTPAA
jgi:hypothetical protein